MPANPDGCEYLRMSGSTGIINHMLETRPIQLIDLKCVRDAALAAALVVWLAAAAGGTASWIGGHIGVAVPWLLVAAGLTFGLVILLALPLWRMRDSVVGWLRSRRCAGLVDRRAPPVSPPPTAILEAHFRPPRILVSV